MKRIATLILGLCLLGIAVPHHAQAADAEKKAKKHGTDVFGKYDVNKNGVLDPDEIATLKKDFDAGNADLKKLDTNGDGKLDDAEIAAIKPMKKHKKKDA